MSSASRSASSRYCVVSRSVVPPSSDGVLVTIPVAAGTPLLEVVRALDNAGVAATDVHRREATLDDVFLTLTSNRLEVAA